MPSTPRPASASTACRSSWRETSALGFRLWAFAFGLRPSGQQPGARSLEPGSLPADSAASDVPSVSPALRHRPGLLLAATGIGVGDMVSSTIAGAEYGLTLVWALRPASIIKFAITEGARPLAARHRHRRSSRAGAIICRRPCSLGFFVYFVVWSYCVSSALVAASALVPAAIFPSVPLRAWGTAACASPRSRWCTSVATSASSRSSSGSSG